MAGFSKHASSGPDPPAETKQESGFFQGGKVVIIETCSGLTGLFPKLGTFATELFAWSVFNLLIYLLKNTLGLGLWQRLKSCIPVMFLEVKLKKLPLETDNISIATGLDLF